MKMNDMFPKNFLAKEDVPHPTVATIRDVTREEVAGDGGKELKAVVRFNGNMKQMILNRGNAQTLCDLYGDDSAAWHGRQVEIYVDPSVSFGGKRVGGLRMRAPSSNAHAHAQPPQATLWDVSDGKTVSTGQTFEQVQTLIHLSGFEPSAFKVKPAGAARELAKTADLYGFGTVPQSDPESSDNVPF